MHYGMGGNVCALQGMLQSMTLHLSFCAECPPDYSKAGGELLSESAVTKWSLQDT